MKERPILFSGEMVSAIIAGYKTQTRRVIDLAMANRFDEPRGDADVAAGYPYIETDNGFVSATKLCPYGQSGDRLWVRETWGFTASWPTGFQNDHIKNGRYWIKDRMAYRADSPAGHWCWRPSIFMPRWANRLTLAVTEVRVERLQDISESDAMSEGVAAWHTPTGAVYKPEFKMLWDKINAKRGFGWNVNPWVWVVSFQPVLPNSTFSTTRG